MSVNEIRDFMFENYYKQIGFCKENSYYSMKRSKKDLFLLANKLIEKLPNLGNARKHLALQFKDTESTIKSKLIELLTQLKSLKFMTLLDLVFK